MMGICQHSLFAGLVTSLSFFNGASAIAGLMVTTVSAPIRIDFGEYRGDGLKPNPSLTQLDSDYWRISGLSDGPGQFGGTHASGDFARGAASGGVATGGVYGFNVGSETAANWAIGFQPIGSDLTPGAVTLMLTNASGGTVDRVDVGYQVLVRNDGDRSSSFQFAYSLDDKSYRLLDGLRVVSDGIADISPGWVAMDRLTSLRGLSLANGASLFLEWRLDDESGTGNRDEWALDMIDVTFGSEINAVPEPATWMVMAIACPVLLCSRRKIIGGEAVRSKPALTEAVQVIRRKVLASIESIPLGRG